MKWLAKLKEFAPDIAMAVMSGGTSLVPLAMKAVSEALGQDISTPEQLGQAIEKASPETMLKVTQASNAFKIKMAELGNELTATELGDVQHAREQHKDSVMPAVICVALTTSVIAFAAALMFVVIPEQNVRMLDTLFGAFLTAWLSSVAYWIGTTRSSGQKTSMLGKKA